MKATAKAFKQAILHEFDSYFKAAGFKRTRHRADNDGFSVIYRQGERYVHFHGSLHPRDYPLFFSVSLGEGSNDFPETDWNSIPLESIIKSESSYAFEKSKDVFSIDVGITYDGIVKKVKASHQFFERYGQPFMRNDLRQYKKLRAEQNKDREPYKIYLPQKDGKYKMEYEKQSSELKEKYSK